MNNLEEFAGFLYDRKKQSPALMPDRHEAEMFIDQLMELLFGQGCIHHESSAAECLESVRQDLASLITISSNGDHEGAAHLADRFMDRLFPVYRLLLQDAAYIESSDPAARSTEEVIITYPGFSAIAIHRFAHELFRLGVPYLPRLMSEHAHSRTGIDIHPGATIGSPFAIDHGTGVVIGETTEIGREVRIYQGVTLGALAVDKALSSTKRHPTIEDSVILYAGCTILGGNTVIGHHSVIGGNVWLTVSVEPYSIVQNTVKTRIRSQAIADEAVDFSI
jgi:serine O-acetyltransferase